MNNNKNYKWIDRLIDKITKDNFPNNISFKYYGNDIHCTSGTNGYVNVYSPNLFEFSLDYWTKQLYISMYSNEYLCNKIVRSFKTLYGEKNLNLYVADDTLEGIKHIEENQLNNEEYDQELVKSELIYLYAYQNFCKDETDKQTYELCKKQYENNYN